jgi:hypothetical protein
LGIEVSIATSLPTEFLSQVQKQWDDSAMILASTTKNGRETNTREKNDGKTQQKKGVHTIGRKKTEFNRQKGRRQMEITWVLLKKLPNYKTTWKPF